jgi:tetratricopeptide (TPR) repeat protein
MSPVQRSARLALFAAAALGLALGSARAQTAQRVGAAPLTLPIKMVDGHLIVQATLFSSVGDDDQLSLEVAFDYPKALTLYGKQYGWLQIDDGAVRKGKDVTVKVEFNPGEDVLIPAKEVTYEQNGARDEAQRLVTRNYAEQLGNLKLVGTLGLGFLSHYSVNLDLAAGKLTLHPLSGETADTSGAAAVVPFQMTDDGKMEIPVASPGVQSPRMIFGSTSFDTLIDPDLAKKLGHPDGDVPSVRMGQVELADYVVFRPESWRRPAPPGKAATPPAAPAAQPAVLLYTGTDLIQAFRVSVDWETSRIAFYAQKNLPSLSADRAYFKAQAANTAAAYQAYLKAYPHARMSAEAATQLMKLRLNEFGVSDDDIMTALQFVIDTSDPERRTENCLPVVQRLAAIPGDTALAIKAGLLGLSYSRDAITTQDVYRMHRVLGEQYLDEGDLQNAWTHFMSAAFVPIDKDPDHTYLAYLGLARVYDRENRYERAYSRYKAALAVDGASVTPAVKKEVTAALERLKAKIPPDQLQDLDN